MCVLPAWAGALFVGASAGAAVVYVDDSAPPGGDGTSWTSAYPTLVPALAAAQAGDEVRVAKGTYLPTTTTNRAATFSLAPGVTLLGGYRGAFEGDGDPNARDPATYPTTLSGAIGSSAATDNSYCVLTLPAGAAPRLVDGLTVEAGYAAPAAATTKSGAGVRVEGGTATLSHLIVRQNVAYESGAGIWSQYATVTVKDSTLSANSVVSGQGISGGAIDVNGGSLVVQGCVFNENANRTGGHIGAHGATSSLAGSLFLSGNAAGTTTQGGGALLLESSDTTIVGCTFNGNQCTTTISGGGAIDAINGSLLVDGCSFGSNRAQYGGAVRSRALAGHVIRESTFSANLAAKGGFALQCLGAVQVDGCTFVENTLLGAAVLTGGTIGVFDPDVQVGLADSTLACSRSTFLKNVATGRRGGACYADRPVQFTACRFLGNSASTGGAVHFQLVPSSGFQTCLFSGNTAGSGGAVYGSGAGFLMSNCTLSGNKATAIGGGVLLTGQAAPVRIDNSVLWGNLQAGSASFQGQLRDDQAGSPILSATIVQELPAAYPGFGNLGANPLFADPDGADGVLGNLDDDLHLLSGSPAIDSGITAAIGGDAADLDGDGVSGEYLPQDLDGLPRVADDPGVRDAGCGDGTAVDRGAFEREGVPDTPLRGDANGDGRVDGADLSAVLAAWGYAAPCEALDFDRSGTVNVADLMTFLGTLWGLESESQDKDGGVQ